MAGYSGTPLAQKLGVKPGATLLLVDAPDGFDALLAPMPDGVSVRRTARGAADVVVVFVTEQQRLERRVPVLEQAIFPNGGLWIAFPKRASGVATDVTDHTIRAVGLPRGLVDNKVCAIDETWTGLRLVWRKEHRS